jgi:mitochondrial import inner membrane translocase subunit TIM50
MWSRVVRKCVAPSALAVRRLATDAAAPVSSPGSVAARVGRDVPLVVVPRDARRQARALARRAGASSSAAVVRTTSLPTKISMGLLVGSATGSIAWHFLLDEATKTAITDTLSPTPLGDLYRMVAAKIEELTKPYRDPFKDKLLPDWPIPQVPPNTPPVPVLVLDLEDTLVHSEWSVRTLKDMLSAALATENLMGIC